MILSLTLKQNNMNTVYLFAGQGQQFLNMGSDLYNRYDCVKKRYDEATNVLGYDVLNLSAEQLNETQYTQPALFVLEAAITDYLNEQGISYDAVTGLSLGEYGALYAAGVISFSDGLEIVSKRGKMMQSAFDPYETGMAAVLKTDFELIKPYLSKGNVEVCNFNTQQQIVIGGKRKELEATIETMKSDGIKRVIPLNVSVVSHMSLLKETSKELFNVLKEAKFKEPQVVFVNNLEGTSQSSGFIETLSRHISEPTHFETSILGLLEQGARKFVEIGPKGSLSKLVKDISKQKDIQVETWNLYDVETVEEFIHE